MAQTRIDPSNQIPAGSLTRAMLNTTTAGSALITKVIAGANVGISYTGVDAGTGDVTVNVASLDNAPVGSITPSTGAFTTVSASSAFQYGTTNVVTAQVSLYNYFFGPSGNLTMTGFENTAVGYMALSSGTTGEGDVAVGYHALMYTTTGSSNTGVGNAALASNTIGIQNSGYGVNNLGLNQSGCYNSTIGVNSGYYLGQVQTAGAFVVGVSYTILTVGTTSFTAIGASANTVGVVFTATGVGAGTGTATPNPQWNTLIGGYAGFDIITGSNNTILGGHYEGTANMTGAIVLATGDGVDHLDYNVANANAWTTAANFNVTSTTASTSTTTGALTVGGGVGVVGNVYAAEYFGSGAGLTALPTSNLAGPEIDTSKVDLVPTTGFSQTVANSCSTLLLKPAGTLATGTVKMPASPADGQLVNVISSQTVTTLTVSANTSQSIVNAPTTITATTPFTMIYDLASTTWYRKQ